MRSPDSESFIDLASPTFSPTDYSIPPPGPAPRTEQPIHHASAHDTRNDSMTDFQSRSPKPRLARLVAPAGAAKPPIPTAPKPDFSRLSLSGQPKAGKAQGSPLSNFASDLDRSLSGLPTTNTLSSRERSQRVRQTHKLTQLFGQTPGVSPISPPGTFDVEAAGGCLPVPTLGLAAKRKHALHRPAASLSDEVVTPVYDGAGELVWPPPDGTRYVSLAPRRHSAPLSPDEFSFMIGPGRRSHESDASRPLSGGDGDGASVIAIGSAGAGSPTSFIDLSDEEGAADGDGDGDRLSEILAETPRGPRSRARRAAGGPLSDSLSPASEAEDERRRKREKLAKLHRFLGSRVPQHLVLGPLDLGAPLPPVAVPSPSAPSPADDADPRRPRMRRRRSSSAAEFSRTWSDDIDRLKEELNEREKAINVRRAVKMEKMFGVAPPQTLYHTRAPTSSSSSSLSANPKPPSPRAPPRSPSAPAFRLTPSESAPKPKSKKKSRRPGTADSAQPLMGSDSQDYNFLADAARSSVYMHYRHSLNSLNDIMDRDDRESLAELHDYLSAHHQFDGPGPGPVSPLADEVSVATPKAERRRSLPSRTSIASFTSEISLIPAATPDAEPSFQQRRRRAAKLTHFFGVDYRELMNEVLESIEKGLEEERGRGTLRPDEVRVRHAPPRVLSCLVLCDGVCLG
ncbi:hypothetical protein C2E23DRAFT_803328 [Lenzites betulinus]|nr:hypothetical protein C2E23DRAFT_803328 [Lenzites betulinus]